MGKSKNFCMAKLSAEMPGISQGKAIKNLASIRQLSKKSTEFAEEIANIIEMLRQMDAPQELFDDLKLNLNILRNIFGISDDIFIREFIFGHKGQYKGALIFVESLSNKMTINESIIKPLMYTDRLVYTEETGTAVTIDMVKNTILSVGNVREIVSINEIVHSCLSGETILLLEGSKEALVISTQAWESRSVVEPETESTVRGPREGFIESLGVNVALFGVKLKTLLLPSNE